MIPLLLCVSPLILIAAQFIQPHPQDVHTFYIWFQLAFERGIFHIYSWNAEEVLVRFQEFAPNYPPFIFSLYPFAVVLKHFHLWPSWPSVGANLFFRIPLLLGQFYLCWKIYQKLKVKTAELSMKWALILLFFNPAFLIAGTIWGQLNFLLWGTLTLSCLDWESDKPIPSALWAALGATIKPQFVMFLPLLCFLILKKRSFHFASRWISVFIVGVMVLCSPFLLTSGLDCLAKGYIRLTGGQYSVADIGYNFWWTLFSGLSLNNLGTTFLGLPYAMIATLLGNGLVAVVGFLFCFGKLKIDWQTLAAYSLLTLFCFLPGMNPQCLIFGAGFLCLLALRDPNYRVVGLLISSIQCLNLAFNAFWTPSTRFYLAPPLILSKAIGVSCFVGVLFTIVFLARNSILLQLEQTEKNQK